MPAKPARKIHHSIPRKNLTGKPTVVLQAVNELVDFVKPTLGPKIRHVLVDMGYRTELMDDGVSIAQEFELEDEFADAVISYVKEAASKTDDGAGDGTTSTMIMLRRLLAELVERGMTYPEARTELAVACQEAVRQLQAGSVKVESQEDLLKVARTSMDDEDGAAVVAEVVWKTGAKGAVTITDKVSRGFDHERLEGFTMGRGFMARGMINDKENELHIVPGKNFKGPVAVAVIEQLLSTVEDIQPIVEALNESAEYGEKKSLAIFCPNIIGEAMGVIGVLQARGEFNVVAIPLPGQGEKMKDYVQDICAVTGAKTPVGEFSAGDFGTADGIRVSKNDTTLIGGRGDKPVIESAIEVLRKQSEDTKDDYEKEYLHQRQARLMGGVVMIRVGGVTETETRLKLKKVEDAVNACKCALEEGVSPGAGAALYRIDSGSNMLDIALKEVGKTVAENAETEYPASDIADGERTTLNVLTGKVGDFLEVGVVDATKVLRTAVENAVSIATILYSTAGIITSKRAE